MPLFIDRADAGRQLARRLGHLQGADAVVLALPRGGVPVGYEVARALGAPLDVIVVRKLGLPFQPEVAMGALGEGGARVLDRELMRTAGVTTAELKATELAARREVRRRRARYRGKRPRMRVAGRTAVLVDDGVATGATARAACQAARALGAARVVLAAPVVPARVLASLMEVADEVVCLVRPEWFLAVGEWYDEFTQLSDEQVAELLEPAAFGTSSPVTNEPAGHHDPLESTVEVLVPAGPDGIAGRLAVPQPASGLVVLAYPSGGARHSVRGRFVAEALHRSGLATLALDLLTLREQSDRDRVLDVELLGERLMLAVDWLRGQPEGKQSPIGLLGTGAGAAATMWAAGDVDTDAAAVVSLGGWPDHAGERLAVVEAPTLLVVGSRDSAMVNANQSAYMKLSSPARLVMVPGAGHRFEEPGTLAAAVRLARDWLRDHLDRPSRSYQRPERTVLREEKVTR